MKGLSQAGRPRILPPGLLTPSESASPFMTDVGKAGWEAGPVGARWVVRVSDTDSATDHPEVRDQREGWMRVK